MGISRGLKLRASFWRNRSRLKRIILEELLSVVE
jgi:hypothetical protein